MSNLHAKNVIYAGFLSGLVLSLICLVAPLATGYQLVAVLLSSVAIGLLFRRKISHSFAVASFGMIYALSVTRYVIFPDSANSILFTIWITLATIICFLLGSKFFGLKMNRILQYAIAVFGFLVVFFVIPLLLLLQARASYTPQ